MIEKNSEFRKELFGDHLPPADLETACDTLRAVMTSRVLKSLELVVLKELTAQIAHDITTTQDEESQNQYVTELKTLRKIWDRLAFHLRQYSIDRTHDRTQQNA